MAWRPTVCCTLESDRVIKVAERADWLAGYLAACCLLDQPAGHIVSQGRRGACLPQALQPVYFPESRLRQISETLRSNHQYSTALSCTVPCGYLLSSSKLSVVGTTKFDKLDNISGKTFIYQIPTKV